ncbi:hypothetical protein [Flavihumibacter petaseus]|uniref:Uncharacterized protein n=1 Tax=Flavihumibacter petaseus NBRC 106054 TaxID=1220578 RepID=A0A0E9MWJ6_9BACT|nr:hypothetical protein [Flavihumibacter petaseus]GAO41949.1 hypothetical protein FPE01S_01_09640 [Flavihumibacter petaseus NBRC 106054]
MNSILRSSVNRVREMLDPIVPDWFVIGGTCLGFVRGAKFISHDPDIDIGILDADESLIQKIIESLPVVKIWRYKGEIREVTLILDCQVDIFFLTRYKGYVVETVFAESLNRVRFYGYAPSIFEEGVEKVFLDGVTVNALKRSVDYCEVLFGESYRVSNPDWNCWNDPGNILFEDLIISNESIANMTMLGPANFEENVRVFLKSISEIVVTRAKPLLNTSVSDGCPPAIVFLYYYAESIAEPSYFNFSNFLLLRNSKLLFETLDENLFQLVPNAVYTYHLCVNGFVSMDDIELLSKYDSVIIRFIEVSDIRSDFVDLIGAYSYLINRSLDEQPFDEKITTKLNDCLSNHLSLLLERVADVFTGLVSGCADFKGESSLFVARAILFVFKCRSSKIFSTELEWQLGQFECLIRSKVNDCLIRDDLEFDFPVLYSFSLAVAEDQMEIVRKRFFDLDFNCSNSVGDLAVVIPRIQSCIRLCRVLEISPQQYEKLHAVINNLLYRNGVLALDPYKSIGGFGEIGLNCGLTGFGLCLVSLFSEDSSLLNWDELILLS